MPKVKPAERPDERPSERPSERLGTPSGGSAGKQRNTLRLPSRSPRLAPPIPASAWLAEVRLPSPQRQDHVIFLRGLPVAPWMSTRPWQLVWSTWLARLEVLFHEWQATSAASDVTSDAADWVTWRESHVHSMEARRVERGLDTLRQVLSDLITQMHARSGAGPSEARGIHLVGHSVGGAVILTYLAELRAHPQEMPAVSLRSALTLDAAVSGLAGAWSGAKSYLHRLTGNSIMGQSLLGLNQWATEQDMRVLTVSNSGDVWSHNRLADLPYLGVRLGSRLALADQLNGTIHDWLRRTPEFVEAIWSLPETDRHVDLRAEMDGQSNV